MDVTDGCNQDSEATNIYGSSLGSLETADSVYVEYSNQDENKHGKIIIYITLIALVL